VAIIVRENGGGLLHNITISIGIARPIIECMCLVLIARATIWSREKEAVMIVGGGLNENGLR